MASIALWASVRDPGGGRFVNQAPGGEALELERFGKLVIAPGCEHVRQRPASGGNGLESPGSPAAVDVQPGDRSGPDDGARVVHYIDDPGPLPQQAQPAEGGKQRESCGDDALQ